MLISLSWKVENVLWETWLFAKNVKTTVFDGEDVMSNQWSIFVLHYIDMQDCKIAEVDEIKMCV